MVKKVIFWDKKSYLKKKRKKSSGMRFIRAAIKKPGAFSKQLGIPEKENIPFTLLNAIIAAKAGDTIKNPTMIGIKRIKVTRLLERRAILARTLKRLKKRKKF